MIVLCVAIVLAAASVATFPCWSYSARWGYGPSVLAGTLLVITAALALTSRTPSKPLEHGLAVSKPMPWAYSVLRRFETFSIEPEIDPKTVTQ